MDAQTLNKSLLKEHARDLRLTIIGLLLTVIAIGAVIVFLLYIGFDYSAAIDETLTAAGEYGWYYRVIFAVIALWLIGSPIFKIFRLRKQSGNIKKVLSEIETGKRASSINETLEYRINIPMPNKTTLRLGAVTYLLVIFEGELKTYKVPVNKESIGAFKAMLSGAKMDDINDVRNDLYGESNEEIFYTANENTPMKSLEEFKQYLQDELSDTLNELANEPKSKWSLKPIIFTVVFLILIYGAYAVFFAKSGTLSFQTSIFIFAGFGALCLLQYIFIAPWQKKKQLQQNQAYMQSVDFSFKTKVLNKIFDFVSPGVQYVMHGQIGIKELLASGIFREAKYNITGNDLVLGRHNGVPFQFCDLTVSYESAMQGKNETPDTVLYGQFFVARFNKSFSSPVYIVPNQKFKDYFFDNDIRKYLNVSGETVELEDPEFMKMFKIYASDQIEARYILTPAMMERIKNLVYRTRGQYYISFMDNNITVVNNSGRNNFEVTSAESLIANDYSLLTSFYLDICDQFAIIDDLKLNIKIWR